jgi:histidine ammonia-lyase
VLALELYTATQALEYRQDMLNAARTLAARGDWKTLAGKISNAPASDHASFVQFKEEVTNLMSALAGTSDFHAGEAVRTAFVAIRKEITFMQRDRAMNDDVRRITEMVSEGTFAAS